MWVWIGWFCTKWWSALCNQEIKLALTLLLSALVCAYLFIRQWLLLTSRFKGINPTIKEKLAYEEDDMIPFLVATDLLTILWIAFLWAYDVYEIVFNGPRRNSKLRKFVQFIRISLYLLLTLLLPLECTSETKIWQQASYIITIFATVLILIHCRLFCTWKSGPDKEEDDPGGDFAKWMGWGAGTDDVEEESVSVLPFTSSASRAPRR